MTEADRVTTREDIDLGSYGSKWKHGWVPLNPAAAALKAKQLRAGGDHKTHRVGEHKVTIAPTPSGRFGALMEHSNGETHFSEHATAKGALGAARRRASNDARQRMGLKPDHRSVPRAGLGLSSNGKTPKVERVFPPGRDAVLPHDKNVDAHEIENGGELRTRDGKIVASGFKSKRAAAIAANRHNAKVNDARKASGADKGLPETKIERAQREARARRAAQSGTVGGKSVLKSHGNHGGARSTERRTPPRSDPAEHRDALESIEYNARHYQVAKANHTEQKARSDAHPSGASSTHAVSERRKVVDQLHASLESYRAEGYGPEVDAALAKHKNVTHTLSPLPGSKRKKGTTIATKQGNVIAEQRHVNATDKAPGVDKPRKSGPVANERELEAGDIVAHSFGGGTPEEVRKNTTLARMKRHIKPEDGLYAANAKGEDVHNWMFRGRNQGRGVRHATDEERAQFRADMRKGAERELATGDSNRRSFQPSLFAKGENATVTKKDTDAKRTKREQLAQRLVAPERNIHGADAKSLDEGHRVTFTSSAGKHTGHVVTPSSWHGKNGRVGLVAPDENGKPKMFTADIDNRGKVGALAFADNADSSSPRGLGERIASDKGTLGRMSTEQLTALSKDSRYAKYAGQINAVLSERKGSGVELGHEDLAKSIGSDFQAVQRNRNAAEAMHRAGLKIGDEVDVPGQEHPHTVTRLARNGNVRVAANSFRSNLGSGQARIEIPRPDRFGAGAIGMDHDPAKLTKRARKSR